MTKDDALKLARDALKKIARIFFSADVETAIDACNEALKHPDHIAQSLNMVGQAAQEPVALLADEVIGCFRAAEIEGLNEALAETTDVRLKDLVERRLIHAMYAAQNITPPQPS